MEVQRKQNSTVIPGNSQQHYQATKEVFLRRVYLPKQPVDPVISSGKQHDCDDCQWQSESQGEEARAVDTASTSGRSVSSAASDPVNPEDKQSRNVVSMLRDELILKNFFTRLLYTQHPSQRQDHEDIPGNVFFEWLGKARISEKNLINIQHFRALARFNGINVRVLVDKPITIAATEAGMETVTGRIETITVARLYQDFRAALKEDGLDKVAIIFKEFVRRTEQHRVGLCSHALRSDYFRLALVYTYGGMHSDVAVSLEDFDPNRGSVEVPLIPLKGKHGLLFRIIHESDYSPDSNDVPDHLAGLSNTLVASSRKNSIILFMLYEMLVKERSLECHNMSETREKKITDKVYAANDRDVMRLYQCSKRQIACFYANVKAKEWFFQSCQTTFLLEGAEGLETLYRVLRKEKDTYEQTCLELLDTPQVKEIGNRRLPALVYIAAAGLNHIWFYPGIRNDLYGGISGIKNGSGFPFPEKTPAIANMKPFHLKGDGSWYKGLSNPRYVEDIDIEYHEYPETSCHDRGEARCAPC